MVNPLTAVLSPASGRDPAGVTVRYGEVTSERTPFRVHTDGVDVDDPAVVPGYDPHLGDWVVLLGTGRAAQVLGEVTDDPGYRYPRMVTAGGVDIYVQDDPPPDDAREGSWWIKVALVGLPTVVGASVAVSWNVADARTVVGASRAVSWGVRARVGRSAAATWDVQTPVGTAMVDPSATAATAAMFAKIVGLSSRTTQRVMTGIEQSSLTDLHRGDAVSDAIYAATGRRPLILNYEIADGGLTGTSAPFTLSTSKLAATKALIQSQAADGHLPLLTMHAPAPTGSGGYTSASTVDFADLIDTGSTIHANWMTYLSSVGDFINSLTYVVGGSKIPVLFKPFHEMTGGNFWWSPFNSSVVAHPENWVTAWRQMVTYLRDVKGCHNIIWVWHAHTHDPKGYNLPDLFSGYASGWEALWPGSAWVDIVSASSYATWALGGDYRSAQLNKAVQIHQRTDPTKPFIFGEVGPPGYPPSTWDLAPFLTSLKTTYNPANNPSGYNTSGLAKFFVGWCHWGGSWRITLQSHPFEMFSDAIACNLGDL